MKSLKDMDDLPQTSEMMIKRHVVADVKNKKFEDKYTLHKKLVFSDKEFTHPLIELVIKYGLEERSMTSSKYVKGTTRFAKLEFIKKDGKKVTLTESELELVNKLAEDFAIFPEDAAAYIARTQNKVAATVDRVAFAYRPKMGLYLRISEGATKEEIKNALKDIDAAMTIAYGQPIAARNKPPQNYELVYAIFKARKKGETFSEIYEQYHVGTLPNYNGSKSLGTLEKFREYYNKFKPSNPL